ncbi:MAG: phosphate ABC transporter permease subunit PstC [Frankiaceae bacterium]|nr:phosphate ABC transporter permease subunit PstC [Frankiaceae bacterium]
MSHLEAYPEAPRVPAAADIVATMAAAHTPGREGGEGGPPANVEAPKAEEPGGAATNVEGPQRAPAKIRRGDRLFAAAAQLSGLMVVITIAAVAVFLIGEAAPSLLHNHANFLTSRQWQVDSATLRFGIVDLAWTTILVSTAAMLIAVPIAVGIALYIARYAPPRLARPVAFAIDLLAAIPSIVYGIWGAYVLGPKLEPIRRFLEATLGRFPVFGSTNASSGTVFVAAVVLAIMILPIITAVSREVFERTPTETIEAAWALGATRWEVIRMAVIPHGRSGVASGAMLGLGRALGETIAVMLILSKMGDGAPFSWSIFSGGETFASKIANNAAEFNTRSQTGAYIAAGFVLFALTFAVNAAARWVVNRRPS